MQYIPVNVMRQNQNFVAIREAGGAEMTNDVYARNPTTFTWWFVGKLARISGTYICMHHNTNVMLYSIRYIYMILAVPHENMIQHDTHQWYGTSILFLFLVMCVCLCVYFL
jgi:hypothetical protein